MSKFSRRLKEMRNLRGLSQTDLARLAKLQPSAVSHFETGRREPNMANLAKLSIELKVTADYLMGINELNPPGCFGGTVLSAMFKMSHADQLAFAKFGQMLAEKAKGKRG